MNAKLSKETIDKMVKDAAFVEDEQGVVPHELVLDLCCYVKALACEVEILHDIIRDASPWFPEEEENHRNGDHHGLVTPDCDDDK